MKTPMQELIDTFNINKELKEKQAIMEAYYNGGTNEPNLPKLCEQYFNEKYNENS